MLNEPSDKLSLPVLDGDEVKARCDRIGLQELARHERELVFAEDGKYLPVFYLLPC